MNRIQETLSDIYQFLITSKSPKKGRLIEALFYGLLALSGIFLWGYFLDWGKNLGYFQDWAIITEPRLTFLKNALIGFHLPLNSLGHFQMGEIFTNRFLAIPDSILSPQIILLWFLSVNQFCLIQIWILFLLGFWGLLKLRRSLSLSPLAFIVLFLLFNFNGHILAHITVGHLSFGPYFLYSWFVYFILEWIRGDQSWKWIAKMVILLLFIVLNGGYHQFIYCLIFLGLLAIFYPSHFWFLIKTILLAVGINLCRFLPEVSILNGAKSTYLAGFIDVQTLLTSLFQRISPADESNFGGLTAHLGMHEFTYYIGILGAIFVLYFGLIRHFTDKKQSKEFNRLIFPLLILGLLCMNQVFLLLRTVLPLPFFTAERVPMRIFSLLLVFLLVLGASQFQKWVESPSRSKMTVLLSLILLLYGMHDIWQNFTNWTISNASTIYEYVAFNPANWIVQDNLQDKFYLFLIVLGWVGTLVCFGFLVYKVTREWKPGKTVYKLEKR